MTLLLSGEFGSIPFSDIAALQIVYDPATSAPYPWKIVAVSKELKYNVTLGLSKYEAHAKDILKSYNQKFEEHLDFVNMTTSKNEKK